MSDKEIIISIRNIGVDYKPGSILFSVSKPALKDVSFDVYRGESLGVVGRNGAGKSTLLKLLAGVIDPDVGDIQHNNIIISLLSLQVGFNGELSGYDNIYLSSLLLGFTQSEIAAKLEDIIEFSELGDYINNPVKTYSTGMRARLGFSIAYQLQPDVLLIDEILGVGDVDFKRKSIEAMKQRIRSDQTIILVSHHGPTIRNLCQRAIWLDDGYSKRVGDSDSVIEEYEKFMLKP